jgi:hypothetical protein
MATGVLQMKTDLHAMTKAELRAYVVAHPNDVEAFHLWVDQVSVHPSKKIYPPIQTQADIAEFERLVRERKAKKQAGTS